MLILITNCFYSDKRRVDCALAGAAWQQLPCAGGRACVEESEQAAGAGGAVQKKRLASKRWAVLFWIYHNFPAAEFLQCVFFHHSSEPVAAAVAERDRSSSALWRMYDRIYAALGWASVVRDAGEKGIPPCPCETGATGPEVPFHNSIISNFVVYQDRLETNFCSYSRTQKIQNGFV